MKFVTAEVRKTILVAVPRSINPIVFSWLNDWQENLLSRLYVAKGVGTDWYRDKYKSKLVLCKRMPTVDILLVPGQSVKNYPEHEGL